MWPHSLRAQTSCEAPNKCVAPQAVNAAADALCRRARTAELKLADVLDDLGKCQTQRDIAIGQVSSLEQRLLTIELQPPKRRSPWWLRSGLSVVAFGLAGTSAYLLSTGAVGELAVGLSAVALGTLGVRLLVQWLDDR